MQFTCAASNGNWAASAAKAMAQLDSLYDATSGVYFISKAMPVGLLMDNIEIYAALKRAGKEAYRLGYKQQSNGFYMRAYALKAGILRSFRNTETGRFIASTQPRAEQGFYPDDVAQLFPGLYGFNSHGGAADTSYNAWMAQHASAWFGLIGKEYPWGMVAVVATQNDDMKRAGCWMTMVGPHRANHAWWNVVDEAAYQAVAMKMKQASPFPATCEGVAS